VPSPGDRVEGTFISIVRRRGEGSIVTTASQIHAQLTAGRALLQEMSTDRLRQEKDRLRLKSDAAVGRVLAVIDKADDRTRRPPGPGGFFSAKRCLDLAAAIRGDEWGITDDIVRERVDCCRYALSSFGANVSNFGGNAGVATLLLQQLLRSTRETLEAYIAEEEVPPWLDLPDSPSGALAWLVRKSLNPS